LNQGGDGPETRCADPDAAGFVLAGGQSTRMGQDKALLPFAGRPLIAHALSILRDAGLSASIAGARASARASLEAFAPVIEDPEPGLGPLAGVCSAIASASARHVVFLPIDLPFLPPSLLEFLLRHARITGRAVTVPSVNGFDQTFPAVLGRAALPTLQAELTAGHGGCFSAFQAAAAGLSQPISRVAVELVAQSGHVAHPHGMPAAQWFLNLNSPADLQRAEALFSRCIA
jgi:molybdopterin-guanine dinucleotide biosynthesis protein A